MEEPRSSEREGTEMEKQDGGDKKGRDAGTTEVRARCVKVISRCSGQSLLSPLEHRRALPSSPERELLVPWPPRWCRCLLSEEDRWTTSVAGSTSILSSGVAVHRFESRLAA
ncbi:hypothetical protein MRX96_011409 [Rhipicephalus microplus]